MRSEPSCRSRSRWAEGVLCLLAVVGCAGGGEAVRPPELIGRTSDSAPGWPYGESGVGTVIHLREEARDDSYGWDPSEPVRVGGFDAAEGEATGEEREIRFLNSLWGPGGETILYEKTGTCCLFTHYGAPLDRGNLDVFSLRWEGLETPRQIYLDRFHESALRIPRGLTIRLRYHPGTGNRP